MSAATPWTRRVRVLHRWISLAFMLAVIANLVALGMGSQASWVGVLALLPLLVLMGTGAVLFVLPYVATRRSARAPADPT
ncbi:MAG: hypothetical protein K1X88_15970 [Nannocystaceae bacterium]|nr:hypothetical protein [Nannocystaceae bacterium]